MTRHPPDLRRVRVRADHRALRRCHYVDHVAQPTSTEELHIGIRKHAIPLWALFEPKIEPLAMHTRPLAEVDLKLEFSAVLECAQHLK